MGIVEDYLEVVYQVDKGVSIRKFDMLLEKSGLQKQVLAGLLGLDPRTIDNYRKQNKKFGALEGELLIKLDNLFMFSGSIFQSMDDFRQYLEVPAYAFDQRKPIDFLNTCSGVDLVMQALQRIAHGYVA
jgi:putative toxin-antitoxin system antitoxin component (TIGR02293 family)